MKKHILRLLIIFALPAFMLAGIRPVMAASRSIVLFPSPASAQTYCRTDAVVWLDARNHVFFYPGDPHFGATYNGGYTCRGLALLNGNLPARW